MELAINAVLTVVGLVMLCFGGSWLVGGVANIAKRLGISNIIIGMTVVAYGTSTPELAASIAAAGQHSQIILGNVVGSNIANIGMVIGVSAILVPLFVNKAAIRKELFVMLGASVLLIAMSLDGEISQYDGVLLIGILITFTVLTCLYIKKEKNTEQVRSYPKSFYPKYIGFLGIGIAFLYIGSELTIDNAVKIAQSFNIEEKIIGITIIAIGTSLPELVTSIIAIRRGNVDIGIGNIIGSNIYNILMIMGIASTLAGVIIVDTIYTDYIIMIAFSLVLLAVLKTGVVSRKIGIGLAIGYISYLIMSFLYL